MMDFSAWRVRLGNAGRKTLTPALCALAALLFLLVPVSPARASQAAATCNTTATGSWAGNCWVREGDASHMVEAVQMVVQGQEICVPDGVNADGIFGPKTLAGVECFQRFEGIGVDGVVGPQTWAALQSALFKCSASGGFQFWSPIYPCPGTSGHQDPIREFISTGVWWILSPISNSWRRINTGAPS
jgi:hypothetical protein